jgi:hypothetical protein
MMRYDLQGVCNVAASGSVAHPEAWGRLKGCQSFSDADDCLTNLKWHLVNSSNHYAVPTDVDIMFESLEPETEEVPRHWFEAAGGQIGAEQPSGKPPSHLLAKRQKTSVASVPVPSSSSSSHGMPATISLHVDRAELSDMLTLRRSTLLTMLDCVERAAAAAKHAVSMSVAARDGFETEERRLTDCARQLARICER